MAKQELSITDQNEREQALNPSQSFIVQAPAGSGKTELLTQRFLVLLAQVNRPEEILAITFTKKSAGEMRTRVINALKMAAFLSEPELNHAKKTWHLARKVLQRDQELNWKLMDNPNQLGIQTIDSLCAYFTKQLPLLSHFGSSPQIQDHPKFLYREAVQELLTHIEENYEWSDALSNLLFHLDNDLNKLHDLLIQLLAKRDQWLPYLHLEQGSQEIKKQLEQQLITITQNHFHTLSQLFPEHLKEETIEIARFATQQMELKFPKTDPDSKSSWLLLANLLLTKSGTYRKKVSADIGFPALNTLKNAEEKTHHKYFRDRYTQLIESLSDNDDLRFALSELHDLPNFTYSDDDWKILQSLLAVLKILSAQLRLVFRNHGQIDFIENANAALLALGTDENPTDLTLALDYQIRHILIDEFQDTSITQYKLLEKLTLGWEEKDGRTLFIVGDPMQSIYRFREAEVGIFIRMWENGIGHIPLIPIKLLVNFRSTPDLISWNNRHFQSIFPMHNDIAKAAVKFSLSVSRENNEASIISINGLPNSSDINQAEVIVNQIKQIKNNKPSEQIAILVRSRTHLYQLIPQLKKAGLLYRAVDIDLLSTKQPIQDLVSLTLALINPYDRIAWLAILRSPLCGLQLSDLLAITKNNPYTCLLEQLESKFILEQLSPDGRQRVSRVHSIVKNKLLERERHHFRTWIEETWLALGGPATLSTTDELKESETFFKILEDPLFSNEFINKEKLIDKINLMFAPTEQNDTAIQIMTIHTAKGLEFETVILPHLEKELPHDEKSLLEWLEQPLYNGQAALLLATIQSGNIQNSIYDYIRKQKKIKSDHEIERLLYVAMTRAKKNVYLYFNTDSEIVDDIKPAKGSFLDKLWPQIQDFSLLKTAETSQDNQETKDQRYLKRLASHWVNPITQKKYDKVTNHQNVPGFQFHYHVPKIIGTTVHYALQTIAQQGLSWWAQFNIEEKSNYFKRILMQNGIMNNKIQDAIQACCHAIENTIADKQGNWLLSSHTNAQSELALTAMINGKMTNLIIDRTFIDEQNIRWIIDYKTSQWVQGDLQQFLDKEQEKYLQQMRNYVEAMRLLDEREIRVGFYFPMIPAWRECRIE